MKKTPKKTAYFYGILQDLNFYMKKSLKLRNAKNELKKISKKSLLLFGRVDSRWLHQSKKRKIFQLGFSLFW
jgi:hypothetical protein